MLGSSFNHSYVVCVRVCVRVSVGGVVWFSLCERGLGGMLCNGINQTPLRLFYNKDPSRERGFTLTKTQNHSPGVGVNQERGGKQGQTQDRYGGTT